MPTGLQFQTIPVAFTKGMDTHTQPKLVMPGKWANVTNLSLAEDGSLKMRDGVTTLVQSANGNGLATHNAELLTINGPTVSSISTAGTDQAKAVSGLIGNVDISKQELRKSTGMQDEPDCAHGDGFTCYVWREKSAANVATGINCTLVDETTGTQLLSNQSLRANANVYGARVVHADSAFFIFYIQGTSLYCRVIATSAPTTVGTETALITSANLGNLNFDACAFAASSVAVAYAWADGVTSVQTIGVTRSGTTPAVTYGPTNTITEANLSVAGITAICCCMFSSGTSLLVAATGNLGAQAGLAGAVLDGTYVVTASGNISPATSTTTTNNHLCACQDSTRIRIFRDFVSEWSTNSQQQIVAQVVSTGLATFSGPTNITPSNCYGVGTTARGPQGPFIHGKPFASNSRIYLPTYVASVYNGMSAATANPRNANTQNTFFLYDTGATGSAIAAGVVVAKALYGSFGVASINGTAPRISTPCSSPQVDDDAYATVAPELTLLVLSAGNNVSPTGLTRLTMSPNFDHGPSRAQLGESTFLAGGSLVSYDGANVVEHGFPLYPEGAAITVNGAGTGAMTAGVHQVVFIYEWVDNSGQRHQSAPSLPMSVTTAATGSLTCVVPTLLMSQKASSIQVVAFMTQAAGTTFYRVLLDNAAYTPVMNTTGATTVTLTIDDSDATIGGNEVLYTQPAQAPTTLPNIAPGPVSCVAVSQNRVWFFKSDQPFQFGYSQEYINNVGLQFSPDLGGSVPAASGGGKTIAPLDEKTILLCRDKLYVVYGSGPNSSGGFNNFSDPQEIPSDVGCSEAASVLPVPRGIIFKSPKGIYLLGRDLSVSYIGDGVAQYDGSPILAATLMMDRQECRFVIGNRILVYSYELEQWSTFLLADALDYDVTDALYWQTLDCYVHISTTMGVNRDNSSVTTDSVGGGTDGINWSAKTAWLNFGALEGFRRIRRLYLTGSSESSPTGSMNLSVDFDDANNNIATGSYTSQIVFGAGGGQVNIASGMPVDIRHKLRRMKCKSVAFTFDYNIDTDATVQPVRGIQAMAIEVGVKRGSNKLSSTQTVE